MLNDILGMSILRKMFLFAIKVLVKTIKLFK